MSSGINPARGLGIIFNLSLADEQKKSFCYLLLFDETIRSKKKLEFEHVLELYKGDLRRLVPLIIQQNDRKDSRTYTETLSGIFYLSYITGWDFQSQMHNLS